MVSASAFHVEYSSCGETFRAREDFWATCDQVYAPWKHEMKNTLLIITVFVRLHYGCIYNGIMASVRWRIVPIRFNARGSLANRDLKGKGENSAIFYLARNISR